MATFFFDSNEEFPGFEHNIDFSDTAIVEAEGPEAPTDVWAAANANDLSALRQLLEDGGNSVDEINASGVTPLHLCASLGHAKMAQYLISKGANIHKCDAESGWTPLHRALYNKRIGLALMLIEHGAKLYAPAKRARQCEADRDGNTPLDLVSLPLTGALNAPKADQIGNIFTFGQFQSQLGYGLFGKKNLQTSPRRVDSLIGETIVTVSAAKYTTFAVTQNGRLFGWGVGAGGRLGTGDERTSILPALIRGPFETRKVRCVAAAKHHTLAVTRTGQLYSWGGEMYGKLGHGARHADEHRVCLTPRQVDGELRKQKVATIAAGLSHSVAITAEGALYAWGSNEHGQLGHNLGRGRSGSNGGNLHASNGWDGSPGPVGVPAGRARRSNSSVDGHAVAHYNQQVVWALPARVFALSVPKRDGRPRKVVNVAASDFTTCVVQSSGRVWQWGHTNPNPTRVTFPGPDDLRRAEGLSASPQGVYVIPRAVRVVDVACARDYNAAISTSGEVFSWSSRCPTELSTPAMPMPVKGLRGKHAVKLAAGATHFSAVIDTGDLFTWCTSNDGDSAALGRSSLCKSPSAVPQNVPTLKRVTNVACGDTHTVVVVTLSRPKLRVAQCGVEDSVHAPWAVEDEDIQGTTLENTSFDTSMGESDTEAEDDHLNRSTVNDGKSMMSFDESEDVVFGADFKASEKTFPTLERLCEIALAKTVDAHNISDVLAYAEAFNCEMLATYCKDFLFMNLDAVLAATRPRERSIMMYQTSVGMIGSENEEQVFDFNEEFFGAIQHCDSPPMVDPIPVHDVPSSRELRGQVSAKLGSTDGGKEEVKKLCSQTPTADSVKTVMRRVKAIRKKLSQIARQEKLNKKTLTEEQKNKIARKAPLAKDLKDLEAWLLLSPELVEEETNRKEAKKKYIEKDNIKKLKKVSHQGKKETLDGTRKACELCSVELDSADDYQAHLQSKRHKKAIQRQRGKGNGADVTSSQVVPSKKRQEQKTPSKSRGTAQSNCMKTPGSIVSPESRRRPSWSATSKGSPLSPKEPKTSLLSIMMQEAENKPQPKPKASSWQTPKDRRSAYKKKNGFSEKSPSSVTIVRSGSPTGNGFVAPADNSSSPILIPIIQRKRSDSSKPNSGSFVGSASPSSFKRTPSAFIPSPRGSWGSTPKSPVRPLGGGGLPGTLSVSPSSSVPQATLGAFMQRARGNSGSSKPGAAWGGSGVASPRKKAVPASPKTPSKIGFMDIMNMEAKKKKEEKYTTALLDRHQSKWFQRDEDNKQSSLEAIMKAEDDAKKAEEARRREERANVELVRRAAATEKSKNQGRRSRRGSKKKKKNTPTGMKSLQFPKQMPI